MIPPHLPAPSCNIEKRKRRERLQLMVVCAILGVWAGGAGAFMILGWLWPATAGDTWAISYSSNQTTRRQIEDTAREELKRQIVPVYTEESHLDGQVGYLSSKNKIGDAIVLSNDGWMALYAPTVKVEQAKQWKVLAVDGKIISVERAVSDRFTNILYLKASSITSTLWRSAAFADAPEAHEEVFVLHTSWQPAVIEDAIYPASPESHADVAWPTYFELSHPFSRGAIVVSPQGKIIGFMNDEKTVLPHQVIDQQLSSLFTRQSLTYNSLGIEGWFSKEQPIIFEGRSLAGFLITKVTAKNSLLHKGDIITLINGQIVEPEKMWYTIQTNKEVRLKILRGGKDIEVKVAAVLL